MQRHALQIDAAELLVWEVLRVWDKLINQRDKAYGQCPINLSRFSGTFEANLFTEAFDDLSIGKDFCKKAKDGAFDFSTVEPTGQIQKALKHPLFWTSAEKISYYEKCLAQEKCNRKKKVPYYLCYDGCNYSLKASSPDSPYKWFQALSIGKDKLKEARSAPTSRVNKKMTSTPIMDLAKRKWESGERKGEQKYNESSWLDFLRFFRNTLAHFDTLEEKQKLRLGFSNGDDGYWGFFSRRFPGLFLTV